MGFNIRRIESPRVHGYESLSQNKEVRNEHLFRFVCVESAVCGQHGSAQLRRGPWPLVEVNDLQLDPYRPELHYMRGPGPKWREKHSRRAGLRGPPWRLGPHFAFPIRVASGRADSR